MKHLTFGQIGRFLKRDHSTIIDACKSYGNKLDTEPAVLVQYSHVVKLLQIEDAKRAGEPIELSPPLESAFIEGFLIARSYNYIRVSTARKRAANEYKKFCANEAEKYK